MAFETLSTPALLLDQHRLDANIDHLRTKLDAASVALRPHLKTCKSLDVAKRMIKPGRGGITVSTLHEADYFFQGGYTDILYAVSIVPQKLPYVKDLQDKGAIIILLLDSVEIAEQVGKFGAENDTAFPCLIEIDCDGKRAGLKPGDPAVVAVARCLDESNGVTCHGVMTHAGGSYYCQNQDEIRAMAEQERKAITDAATGIREAGLPCPVVSMGSTPTAYFGDNFNGVTEIRAGVYVFQDMVMEALQVCDTSQIALSVLAAVISHKKDKNRVLVDAGSLALSADPGKKNAAGQTHYGRVCDVENCAPYPDLWISSTNQEHGLISLEGTNYSFDDFPVGSRIRILPNHACITAAAYPGYHVTDAKGTIIDYWERSNGW